MVFRCGGSKLITWKEKNISTQPLPIEEQYFSADSEIHIKQVTVVLCVDAWLNTVVNIRSFSDTVALENMLFV